MSDRITESRIVFGMYDVTAKKTYEEYDVMNVEGSIDTFIRNEGSKIPKDYATLELNKFVLDGSSIIPYHELDVDYIGAWGMLMSGADCTYTGSMYIDILFDESEESHSSIGITLRNPLETQFGVTVKWYDSYSGRNLIASKSGTIAPLTSTFLQQSASGWKYIRIEFNGTSSLPYRYPRISQITFGTEGTFDKANIISGTISEEIDLSSRTLPSNSLEFEAIDPTGLFNILNMNSSYQALQERQRIDVYGYLNSTIINLGSFYYKNIEASNPLNPKIKMTAQDMIGLLDSYTFPGAVFDNITVQNAVLHVLSFAGFTSSDAEFYNQAGANTISGMIGSCTCREALRQIAFGGMVAFDCSRSAKLKCFPRTGITRSPSSSIPRQTIINISRKIETHEVSYDPKYSEVDVYDPDIDIASSYTQIINSKTLAVGTHTLTFKKPYYDISINQGTGTGTITSQYGYSCTINVTASGTFGIRGKEYSQGTEWIRKVKDSTVTSQNIIEASGMSLTSGNARDIADDILYYLNAYNYCDTGDILMNTYDITGAMASVYVDSSHVIAGHLIGCDIDITTLIAKTKVKGAAVEI